ncbi:hypothetical protein [Pandoraea sp. NPDC090278]|uniref:hypothetical protein n=1 Tax=Pandoraea sp. NPDC090278 TaxID=3364391 RepID=UPI00383B9780
MTEDATNEQKVTLVSFGKEVTLAGAVPRTLSGSEAGRVLGFGCRSCTGTETEK